MAINQSWFPPLMSRQEQIREELADVIGICTNCREYTKVLSPCCQSSVLYDGDYYLFEDKPTDAPSLLAYSSYFLDLSRAKEVSGLADEANKYRTLAKLYLDQAEKRT